MGLNILLAIIGLIVGLFVGIYVANSRHEKEINGAKTALKAFYLVLKKKLKPYEKKRY